MRLALISPNENTCTETFIQLHREKLAGEIHYMYGGLLPLKVNHGENISPGNPVKRFFIKYIGKVSQPSLNERERYLYRYLKKKRIDVVLAEYGQTGASILNLCRYYNAPLVVHFHGQDAYRFELLKTYHVKYREMFAYATTIISVSKDMTNQLISLGCPKNKIALCPYGPAEQFYSSDSKFEKKNFITVGRFVEKKAPYLTLDAFRRTLIEQPDSCLIMIGDGPLIDVCRNIVKAWGLEKSVRFKGVLSQKEILKYFSECIAYIQHSIVPASGDSEGTPVSILEACAAGLPIIATRHAGINDVVIDGETGYLVDETDTKSMSEYMIRLAKDNELAAKLGHAAKGRVLTHFNLDSHISMINKIVENAVNPAGEINA